MQVQKKSESKLLVRTYVEVALEGKAGLVKRSEAISMVAKELGVPFENVGLISLDQSSGTRKVLGRFYVYGSAGTKDRLHPKYLSIRTLSKEEKEKLKAEEKKKKAAPAQAETK